MLTDSSAAATYGHQSSTDGGAVTDWSGQGRLTTVLQSGGGVVHICRQCQPQGTYEVLHDCVCTS